MTAPIWKQLSSGRAIDLARPNLSAIDIWADLAAPLSGIARFDAHADDNKLVSAAAVPTYSVAQHCVVGAEALLAETSNITLALAFLMHDAHEAFFGDFTTPAAKMLEAAMAVLLGRHIGPEALVILRKALAGRGPVSVAIEGCKATLDRELRKLCGLPETLPRHIEDAVKEMDIRMLDTERRQILGDVLTEPYDAIWPPEVLAARAVRTRGELRPWTRSRAAAEWYRRFEQWRIQPAKAA